MKKIIYSTIILLALFPRLHAQDSFGQVLSNIEANNTTLKALREQANAEKIENKTGINLANPELEFGYLWGSPKGVDNKMDFNVTQSFDFPTSYRYRSQLTDGRNVQVDLAYRQQVKDILGEARNICVELVYQTKLNKELEERTEHARNLHNAYKMRFDKGDVDIIEYNKTKLNLLSTEKTLELNRVEINTLKSELQRMNGGEPVSDIIGYSSYSLPLNFDQWFSTAKENNPSLKFAEKDVELSRKQEQLTRSLNLPKFSAGYASERIPGTSEVQQGISIGVSIPLWEGRNTVKHRKAQTIALQVQEDDLKLQFRNTLWKQYDKAGKLRKLLNDYNEALAVSNNRDLLKKALDKGQLSLINYIVELTSYYETVDQYMETEKDYQLAIAELQQWE